MEKEIGSEIEQVLEEDGPFLLENHTDISDAEIVAAIEEFYPEIAKKDIAILDEWDSKVHGRHGGIVGQNKYVKPGRIFEQFKAATAAARDDDVVANYLETTEQLAFKRVDLESLADKEEENSVWDQIKDDISLEQKCRQIWRELGIISQCYIGVIWNRKDYKAKNLTEGGKKSKKIFKNLLVPQKLVLLDPCKVIPVGDYTDELVYIASDTEATQFDTFIADKNTVGDNVFKQWIVKKYEPDDDVKSLLHDLTGSYGLNNNLYLLDPNNVFRITSTKPDYQRFADVRLLSVFQWLDMKQNLMESDRADILGNLNAIIVVRRGDKDTKVSPQQLAATAAQMKQSAKLPIMVGDHTLDIEIVTRKTDNSLRPERYNAIDARLTSRLYQILQTGNYAAGTATDNSPGLFKVIAATMEARRDNIIDELMRNVFDKVYDRNDSLEGEPRVKTRRIALDFDPHWATYIFDLFALNQISHETVLDQVDLDMQEEVNRKRKEKAYSDVFSEPIAPGTAMPGNSTGSPAADGRIGGGNNNGGGENQTSYSPSPKTGQGDDK